MKSPSSTQWLIKTGGRILGPYGYEDVLVLLKTREVAILDEVAMPMKRWTPIRDEATFSNIADDLRQAQTESGELTMTTTEQISEHLTESITLNADDSRTEDLSPTPNFSSTLREIVYENVEDRVDAKPRANAARYQMSDSANAKIDQVSSRTSSLMWVITLAVLAAVLSFVAYQRLIVSPRNAQQNSADAFREGEMALRVGDLKAALGAFKRVAPEHPQVRTTDLYLGLLLIQVEGQTLVGKRFLGQVQDHSPERRVEALTGMGLAELVDGNLGNARDFLKRALDGQPNFAEAHANLAIIDYLEGNYAQAQERLVRVFNLGLKDRMLVLLHGQLNLHLSRQPEFNPASRTQVMKSLDDFMARSFDYLQEVALIRAYFDLGTGQDFERRIRTVLDVDPYLTEGHMHNIYVYRRPGEWTQLLSWCQQMVGADGGREAYLAALNALCLAKSGRAAEAKAAAETAVAQSPRDPQIQAIYAFVLEKGGMGDQASLALGKAMELNRSGQYELPKLLQARFCLQAQDWDCVLKTAQELLDKNPQSLQGRSMMAAYYLQNKNPDFIRHLKQAEALSPDYKLLRLLRERAKMIGLLEPTG